MSKFKIIITTTLFMFLNCAFSEQEYCERYYKNKYLADFEKCGGYLYLQDSIRRNGTSPQMELIVNEALYRCLNYFQMKKECGKESEYIPYTGNKYR